MERNNAISGKQHTRPMTHTMAACRNKIIKSRITGIDMAIQITSSTKRMHPTRLYLYSLSLYSAANNVLDSPFGDMNRLTRLLLAKMLFRNLTPSRHCFFT